MGMVVGLFISGAMFFHKMKLQTLEAELLGDINFHVGHLCPAGTCKLKFSSLLRCCHSFMLPSSCGGRERGQETMAREEGLLWQETVAKDERSRRELAEQMQSEADTERTKIQVCNRRSNVLPRLWA